MPPQKKNKQKKKNRYYNNKDKEFDLAVNTHNQRSVEKNEKPIFLDL